MISDSVPTAIDEGWIINLGDLALLPTVGAQFVAAVHVPLLWEFIDTAGTDSGQWEDGTKLGCDFGTLRAVDGRKCSVPEVCDVVGYGQRAVLVTSVYTGNEPLSLGVCHGEIVRPSAAMATSVFTPASILQVACRL